MTPTRSSPLEMQCDGLEITSRRGVVFLTGHPEIISPEKLKMRCDQLAYRQLRSRMGRWISRPAMPDEKQKYHGWDRSEHRGKYVNCFVFKFQNSKNSLRLYGFLCNPDIENPRFQMFVPVRLETKRTDDADVTILNQVVAISRDAAIVACTNTFKSPPVRKG